MSLGVVSIKSRKWPGLKKKMTKVAITRGVLVSPSKHGLKRQREDSQLLSRNQSSLNTIVVKVSFFFHQAFYS